MPFASIRRHSRTAGRPTRAAAAAACAYDLATLAALLGAGALLGALWLLVRTDGGRLDAPSADATVIATLCAALLPAWAAMQGGALWTHGRTAGGARLTLAPTAFAARGPRALWLALHPALLPAWWWLLIAALVAERWLLVWAFLALAGVLHVLAVGSALLALLRPGGAPLHARLAARA